MKEKLYIYIDESGDVGIKLNEGSSRFFVVALVTVRGEDSLDVSKNLQHIIGNKEIKFSKSHPKRKTIFFNKIKSLNFRGEIFVFNKIQLKLNYEESIIYCLKESLSKDYVYSVFIDGLNKNSFSGQSADTISRNFKNISKIYLLDSKKNYMIQLADMLAGLVNALCKDKNNYHVLLEQIQHKIKITHIK